MEDLLERKKEGLVCGYEQNGKAGGKTVKVLRDLHPWSVATDRERLSNLVGTALDSARVIERLGQHTGSKCVSH